MCHLTEVSTTLPWSRAAAFYLIAGAVLLSKPATRRGNPAGTASRTTEVEHVLAGEPAERRERRTGPRWCSKRAPAPELCVVRAGHRARVSFTARCCGWNLPLRSCSSSPPLRPSSGRRWGSGCSGGSILAQRLRRSGSVEQRPRGSADGRRVFEGPRYASSGISASTRLASMVMDSCQPR